MRSTLFSKTLSIAGVASLLVGLGLTSGAAIAFAQESDNTENTDTTDTNDTAQTGDEDTQAQGEQDSSDTAKQEVYEVSDVTFRWQINKEASGGAFFGGCNFLVAGRAGDNGASGVWTNEFAAENYKTEDGNVTITRPNADSSAQVQPVWESKCIDNRTGKAVRPANPVEGNDFNTGDQVNIAGGAGKVKPSNNEAVISWDGDFTIVFYGGMTYWSISDIKLEMKAGVGKITGTASGFGADMYDTSKWVALPEQQIVLATFNSAEIDEKGANIAVDYHKIEINSDGGMSEQVRNGENWGSFPQEWIDFNKLTGQSSYWYSSGGTLDPKKPALPFTVEIATSKLVDDANTGADDQKEKPKGQDDNNGGGNNNGGDTPAPAPNPTDPTEPTTKDWKGATFYWSLNKEANGGAFFGGCNFLAAGVPGNTGSSRLWQANEYSSKAGNVTIEKYNGQNYEQASWDTKCLDRNGKAVTTASTTSYTESRVKITGGEVIENGQNGTVKVQWKGSFSVVFYGGMTYWWASDPVLTLDKNGNGKVTASASGYGASMADSSKWVKLADRTITLADLNSVDMQTLLTQGGITHTPEYLGIKYTGQGESQGVVGGGAETATGQAARTADNASYWGAFPSDFVDFQKETGQFSYWFTSNGQRDAAKPTLPMTVIFDGASYKEPEPNPYDPGTTTVPSQPSSAAVAQTVRKAAAQAQAKAANNGIEDLDSLPEMSLDAYSAGSNIFNNFEITPEQMLGGGISFAGVGGLNLLLAYMLRRRLGLDPHMYV